MSIRLKMALWVVLVFIVGGLGLGFALQKSFSIRVQSAATDSLKAAELTFAQLEKVDTEKLSSALIALEANDAFRGPFVARDREALLAAAKPIFDQLKGEHSVTHWYFESLPESGTVFLRVHKPEQFDDALKRKTYLLATKDETQSAGLELGKTAVALRVVRPYHDKSGALIGYMELGQEIDSFMDEIKGQTGNEVGLLLLKSGMDEAGWGDYRKSKGLENNWSDNEAYVLAGTTGEEVDLSDIQEADGFAAASDGPQALGVFSRAGGGREARGTFPIKDAGGETIGLVYVETDMTGVVAQLATTRNLMLAAITGMLALVLIVVIILMNTLVFNRLDHMIENMEDLSIRLAGGDFSVTFVPSGRPDEIGKFEQFFGDFIAMVGAALKQLSDSVRSS
jgi:HAMP domain-containing protein